MTSCSCIADINAQLDGQELETCFVISRHTLAEMSMRTFTPLVNKGTGRRERRRTVPTMAAHKFCPFCGACHADEIRSATIGGDV